MGSRVSCSRAVQCMQAVGVCATRRAASMLTHSCRSDARPQHSRCGSKHTVTHTRPSLTRVELRSVSRQHSNLPSHALHGNYPAEQSEGGQLECGSLILVATRLYRYVSWNSGP